MPQIGGRCFNTIKLKDSCLNREGWHLWFYGNITKTWFANTFVFLGIFFYLAILKALLTAISQMVIPSIEAITVVFQTAVTVHQCISNNGHQSTIKMPTKCRKIFKLLEQTKKGKCYATSINACMGVSTKKATNSDVNEILRPETEIRLRRLVFSLRWDQDILTTSRDWDA